MSQETLNNTRDISPTDNPELFKPVDTLYGELGPDHELVLGAMRRAQENTPGHTRRAELARREGNYQLANRLEALKQLPVIDVPSSFEAGRDSDGNYIEHHGVLRRLAGGIDSLEHRGLAAVSIELGELQDGKRKLALASHSANAWGGRRSWLLDVELAMTPEGLKISDSMMSIGSSTYSEEKGQDREWSVFKGKRLDSVIAPRIKEILAVQGFRTLPENLPDNWWAEFVTDTGEDEHGWNESEGLAKSMGRLSDMHPDLYAAAGVALPNGDIEKIYLWDNIYGQAGLTFDYKEDGQYGHKSIAGSSVEEELVKLAWQRL